MQLGPPKHSNRVTIPAPTRSQSFKDCTVFGRRGQGPCQPDAEHGDAPTAQSRGTGRLKRAGMPRNAATASEQGNRPEALDAQSFVVCAPRRTGCRTIWRATLHAPCSCASCAVAAATPSFPPGRLSPGRRSLAVSVTLRCMLKAHPLAAPVATGRGIGRKRARAALWARRGRLDAALAATAFATVIAQKLCSLCV